MKGEARDRVIVVCQDQPLTAHEFIAKRYHEARERAARHASRFRDIDLVEVQERVEQNTLEALFKMDGRILGLLDTMNYLANGRKIVDLTPENAGRYLTLADRASLNGFFLFDFLRRNGYRPELVQNFVLGKNRLERLLADPPLAVCISTTLLNLDAARQMAAWIKRRAPQTPVIVGGAAAHKTLERGEGLTDQTKRWIRGFATHVDAFIVEAQGERTLLQLLRGMASGGELSAVPNLALPRGGEDLVFTRREPEPILMDDCVIQWDRIPARYLRRTLPIQTGKGCRFRCRFCTHWKLVNGVHYKSVEAMRREFRILKGMGTVDHVEIIDDNFTSDPGRMDEILRMMVREDLPFTWSSHARCDAITPERARLMRDSGCEFVEMGLESGDQEMLDRMGKKTRVDAMYRAVERLNAVGIDALGFFILGFPGETEETLAHTMAFIETSGLPYYQFMHFSYSSGMLIARERRRYGITGLAKAWRHNTMDAVEASRYWRRFFMEITSSATEGQASTRETFKLLRDKGYSPKEIKRLFRLFNQLNRIRLQNGDSGRRAYDGIFNEMEAVMASHPSPLRG